MTELKYLKFSTLVFDVREVNMRHMSCEEVRIRRAWVARGEAIFAMLGGHCSLFCIISSESRVRNAKERTVQVLGMKRLYRQDSFRTCLRI